jgi:hypothetical protein
MIKAFPLYGHTSGCDYHRVRLPFIHSHEYVDHAFYKDFTIENADHYFERSEVIIYNRAIALDKVKQFKSAGVKIVCDVDDYWILHHEHPLYHSYNKELTSGLIANMRAADLVTTTTERLANLIRSYNKNVAVIPNALPFGWGQFSEGTKGTSFIYAGLSSHLKDVRLLSGITNQLHNENVEFTLAGFKNESVFIEMAKIFGKCKTVERLPLDNYMNCYDGSGVSLVPLVNNNFNAHKSNLKILEAAAKKIPAIVSFVPPYSDDSDAPVLWVKNKSDWYKHIKALHESEAMRFDYGQQLYEWAVKRYSLGYWNKIRFELYKNLID